jgi:L-alanine-DL-glutamate epimerase-like enolase superfamily enzyme
LLKPFVVGKNLLEIEAILAGSGGSRSRADSGGYSAIDIALHDLAGKDGVPGGA